MFVVLSVIVGAMLPLFTVSAAMTYSLLTGQVEWSPSELPKIFQAIDLRIREPSIDLIDTTIISPLFETMLLAIAYRLAVQTPKSLMIKFLSGVIIVSIFAITHGTGAIFAHIMISFSAFILILDFGYRIHSYALGSIGSFLCHSTFNFVLS